MCLIVYDGVSIVVDRTDTDGSSRWLGENVWEGPAGEVIAGIGSRELIVQMKDWYLAGQQASEFPEAQRKRGRCVFVVATPDWFIRFDKSPVPIKYGRHFCAFGAGFEYAIGALEMGAYAIEAAEIALKHAGKASMGLNVIKLVGKSNADKRGLH